MVFYHNMVLMQQLTQCIIASAAFAASAKSMRSFPTQQHVLAEQAKINAGEEGQDPIARRTSEQSDIVQYHLWPSEEIHQVLDEWKDKYPDLVRITTSQEKYGLPTAGGSGDCPFYTKSSGCPNYIMTIQDFVAHPEGEPSSNALPEIFWSGCLHGNERVGPTAVMEAASLLLEAATCEALPRFKDAWNEKHSNGDYGHYETQLHQARECRKKLKEEKGIDDAHRRWLARLVTTRRIVVVPTTNALGYYQDRREELDVDPNRDFPYDLTDPRKCMQTIAGRTVNEIYREHMFQLALTFHAGMEVVGYEWGAPTWLDHWSPDDVAQKQIGAGYSRYGAGWSKSKPYNYGTMNDLVYYVRGGMEDWAYAGSWDPDRVIQCDPVQFGGYDKEKTKYNDSTLRVFNMLVETSHHKTPSKGDLGTSLDVLHRDTKGNGHVSRNIRLALLSAEFVEPYVSIIGVNTLALSDDIVPLSGRQDLTCQKNKAVMVAKNAKEVTFQFTVGGAMAIDNTEIWFANWDAISKNQLDCLMPPANMNGFQQGEIIGAKNGTGFYSVAGSHPRPSEAGSHVADAANGPVFTGKITIPEGVEHLDQLVIIASARVDQEWSTQPANTKPEVPPQSHLVNARTNPNWRHESAGKVIQGRLDWYSAPLTVVIGDFTDSAGNQFDHVVTTREAYPRFGGERSSGVQPKQTEQLDFPLEIWHFLVIVVLLLACCFCCMSVRKGGRQRRLHKSEHANNLPSDHPLALQPNGYTDDAGDEESSDSDSEDGMELPSMA